MPRHRIPQNLRSLYGQEEILREKAEELVARETELSLHLSAIEHAMNLADLLRKYPTDDEDIKVIQILGMRTFNAFGASTKLGLSGYSQNSAMIMRDILETVFLLDLFNGDREKIEHWRIASKKDKMKNFSPYRVREALDDRDGFTERKRAEIYGLLSELAAHPSMSSALMMRPQRGGDAVIGPFIESSTLEAVLAELGRLAIQVGEILDQFFPKTWNDALPTRVAFAEVKQEWIETFYAEPADGKKSSSAEAVPAEK